MVITIIARAMDCIQIEANGACRGRWCNQGRGEGWWCWMGALQATGRCEREGSVSVNAIDENLYQILWIGARMPHLLRWELGEFIKYKHLELQPKPYTTTSSSP